MTGAVVLRLAAVCALALAPACADTAAPADVASIDFIAGSPAGTVSHALAVDPAVIVRDEAGAAIAGRSVTFTVVAGDGFITDTIIATDAAGRASTRWSLGPRSGESQRLRASADGIGADFEAWADVAVAGRTYFGASQHIEYIAGELPVVITAPHGGLLTPASIPDRTWGTIGRDTNTQELARAIADAFVLRTGGRPHVIINRLHRIKLDANREVVEAAQGNAIAGLAWLEFHAYTAAARLAASKSAGRAFYIDLHGHGHAIPRLELGYTLSPADLALTDAEIEQPAIIDRSSIRTLARTSTRRFAEILRGATSLGAGFEAEGWPAVPAPGAPDPGGADYFTGGYNVQRHGSRDGGPVDGVQLEVHFPGARDTDANRVRFAASVARVLDTFMAVHYGLELGASHAWTAGVRVPSRVHVTRGDRGRVTVSPARAATSPRTLRTGAAILRGERLLAAGRATPQLRDRKRVDTRPRRFEANPWTSRDAKRSTD